MPEITLAEKIAVLRKLHDREIEGTDETTISRDAVVLTQILLDLHRQSNLSDQG